MHVLLQKALYLLLLDLKRSLYLFEFLCNLTLKILALLTIGKKLLLNFVLVDFFKLTLLNQLIHFNKEFSAELNLAEHIALHAYIMVLMGPEESAV